MKVALLKDILREIRHTFPRFLSITVMIALGVFVFTGLKGAAPLMKTTINQLTEDTKMADIKIDAPFGLNEDDVRIISQLEEIKETEWIHSINLNLQNSELLIQLQSIPAKLSVPLITQGRLPEKAGEILLDDTLQEKGFEIGQVISFKKENSKFSFDQNEKLKQYQYTIVGFAFHPEFIHPSLKGDVGGGLGKLDGFAFIEDENFNMEYWQSVRIQLNGLESLTSDTMLYKEKTLKEKENLEEQLRQRPKIRLMDLKEEARNKINENEQKLKDAKQDLADGAKKLSDAFQKIEDGKRKLEDAKITFTNETKKAEKEIRDAEITLSQKKIELDDGQAELNSQSETLKQAEADYSKGFNALETGKKTLLEQEQLLLDNRQTVENALSSVQKGLNELEIAENKIKEQTIAIGTSFDELKAIVAKAVKEDNLSSIETLGTPAVTYFHLLKKQLELEAQNSSLSLQKRQLDSAFSQILVEKEMLAKKEKELQQAKKALEEGNSKLAQAQAELEDGYRLYQDGISRLATAKTRYRNEKLSGEQKIANAVTELNDAEKKYTEKKTEFDDIRIKAESDIAEGEEKIDDAKKILNALKERAYTVATRDDNSYYFVYYDSATRMELLSNIFPIFFYFIAMLVCLSTMTRMAEEHRIQIGTLKALGYGNWDIAKKYVYYGLFSSLLGGIIGISTGQPILSKNVYNAYRSIFVVQHPPFQMFWRYNLYSVLIGILCTAVVAFWVVNKHLKESAASLMRPKAPKSGTTILLERFRWLWNSLSFLQKVTARNMFRYKVRMSMTILGIAGCTGLVFLGFALKDSVSELLPVQYEEITLYDYRAIYDYDISNEHGVLLEEYLNTNNKVLKHTNLAFELASWKELGYAEQKIQIIVPQDVEYYEKMQILRQPNKKSKQIAYPQNGVILTDKIARLANVQVGDTIAIKDSDNKKIIVPVEAIAENYLGHFMYMTAEVYTSVFGKEPIWNTKAIDVSDLSEKENKAFLTEMLDFDVVIAVTETRLGSAEQTVDSLDIVVGIMLFVSSLLAFIVLYNLTNINISERVRELCTIKVLGFYPRELTAYVYRETFFLSLIGIAVGYVVGNILHQLILQFIVADAFQLYGKVFPFTYIISAIMTLIFSLIVMIFVHFRLNKIDMVEALKSYE